MSIFIDPDHVASAETKPALIDAAKMIDPFALIRKRPSGSVRITTGIGAVLGMSGERIISATHLAQTHSILARKVVLAIGVYETARANQAAQAESRL